MTSPNCCDYWPKIRPHLGWFQIDGTNELVMPVIGTAAPGAIRVDFCPSCGAPRRDATWEVQP